MMLQITDKYVNFELEHLAMPIWVPTPVAELYFIVNKNLIIVFIANCYVWLNAINYKNRHLLYLIFITFSTCNFNLVLFLIYDLFFFIYGLVGEVSWGFSFS